MHCEQCGASIQDNMKFCVFCGAEVIPVTTPEPPLPPEEQTPPQPVIPPTPSAPPVESAPLTQAAMQPQVAQKKIHGLLITGGILLILSAFAKLIMLLVITIQNISTLPKNYMDFYNPWGTMLINGAFFILVIALGVFIIVLSLKTVKAKPLLLIGGIIGGIGIEYIFSNVAGIISNLPTILNQGFMGSTFINSIVITFSSFLFLLAGVLILIDSFMQDNKHTNRD